MSKEKYYITTAIAYTSRKPHIGNSYEIVLTDAIARYKRMQGYDVFFLTGTDEHGQKIEEYAKNAGVSPKEYVDKVAGEIRGICDLLNTTYDKFIRTTDDYHEKVVQKIFRKLYDQGDIYRANTKACTACPVRASSPSPRSLTASARIAAVSLSRQRKRHISSECQNIRSSSRIISRRTRTLSIPRAAKRKWSTIS